MADDGLLGQRLRLRPVLVSGRLICERLNELISEYFNVGPLVVVEGVGGLLCLFAGDHGHAGGRVKGLVVFLGDDDGGVGVAPEDPLVPHEVVVDEFAD